MLTTDRLLEMMFLDKRFSLIHTIESTNEIPKYYELDTENDIQIGELHQHSEKNITAWDINRNRRDNCQNILYARNFIQLAYEKRNHKSRKAIKEQLNLF